MTKKKTLPCPHCHGFGMWLDGTAPMGRDDAYGGMPTIPCPKCGADKNPIKNTKG